MGGHCTGIRSNDKKLGKVEYEYRWASHFQANKLRSTRRVEPVKYMCNPGNVISIRTIVDYIEENDVSIRVALLSLCINLLEVNGL